MASVDNKEFKKYGGALFPSVSDLTAQILDFGEKLRPKAFQFTLIAGLTILIGVTASLTRSPQAFMAGPPTSTSTFEFDESKYVSSTSYLVAFGITKAFGNVICGMLCDTIGRRPVHILGWFIAIPIPIMIILAPNWSTVVAADMFLGFNQAFTWMTSIIMMVDLAGPSHRGIAIGMSESIASIADACFSLASAKLINKDTQDYRTKPYYVVAAAIGLALCIAVLFLKETKYSVPESKKIEQNSLEEGETPLEEATTEESPDAQSLLYKPARANVIWPSGRNRSVHVLHMAFVETSFLNISLMSICFAGMMVNFVTGLGWGLSVKWLRLGVAGKWAPLTIVQTSYVAVVYGIVRGVTQFVSGFFSDEFGRRDIIVFGLTLDAIALIIVAFTGQFVEGFDANYGIFLFCAALNGLGTGSSYPSLLAAVIDHTDESYKAAALGSYRFWRDLGYSIGAIVSAAIADSIGIPNSVGITGGLIALAAITVAFFYEERRNDGVAVAIPMENNDGIFTDSLDKSIDKKDMIPHPSS